VDCRIEVENTFDSLHAHVELADGFSVEPGDCVRVLGEPVVVPYGAKLTLIRRAQVTCSSRLERAWTRATGDLEFMELCEFSFSSGDQL
jgi:hypothetical protein